MGMIYSLEVEMTYKTVAHIDADSLSEAIKEAESLAGDGRLLRDADITDVQVEEIES